MRSLCSYSFWDFNFNQTFNADSDSQQLQRVQQNLRRKCRTSVNRRNIVFLFDNTRPDSARIIQEKIFVCSTPSTIFRRPCTKWFLSFLLTTKCLKLPKISKQISWKHLLKTWSWNQLNFVWEELISNQYNGKRWVKIIAKIQMIQIYALLTVN